MCSSNMLGTSVPEEQKRFFAIKLLEKDDKIQRADDIMFRMYLMRSKQLEDKFDDDYGEYHHQRALCVHFLYHRRMLYQKAQKQES